MQELLLACGAAVLVPSPCSKYRLGWCLPLPYVPEFTVSQVQYGTCTVPAIGLTEQFTLRMKPGVSTIVRLGEYAYLQGEFTTQLGNWMRDISNNHVDLVNR